MIGVDTNVLLRLLVVDDARQNALALAFFAKRSPADQAYIPLVVLAEFAWVLKKRYKYSFDKVGEAIQAMLDSDDFAFEQRETVEWSVTQFGGSRIDFSDLLISRAGQVARCTVTVTFDRDASDYVSGMELLQ